MEKNNEYYDLIERLLKNHKKFNGYEAIAEDIIDDVYSHSESVLKSVKDENVVEGYLNKVISTSIITVSKKLNFHNELKHRTITKVNESESIGNYAIIDEKPFEQLQPASIEPEDDILLAQVEELSLEAEPENQEILSEDNSADDSDIIQQEEFIKNDNETPHEEIEYVDKEEFDYTEAVNDEIIEYSEEEQVPEEIEIDEIGALEEEPEDTPEQILPEINDVQPEVEQIVERANPLYVEKMINSSEKDDYTQSFIIENNEDLDIEEIDSEPNSEEVSYFNNESDDNNSEEFLVEEDIPNDIIVEGISDNYSENDNNDIIDYDSNEDYTLSEIDDEQDVASNIGTELQEDLNINVEDEENTSIDIPEDESYISEEFTGANDDFLSLEDNSEDELTENDDIDNSLDFSDEVSDYDLVSEELEESSSDFLVLSNETETKEDSFKQTDYSLFAYTPTNEEYTENTSVGEKVLQLNKDKPELHIKEIFNLRFKNNKTISEIEEALGIETDSVINALNELVKLV